MKRTVAFLLAVCVLFGCCGCAGHSCESPCESCGLCLNTGCQESACADKCQGHHTCANTCPDCGLCTNAECTDAVCTQKCQGHHSCSKVCPDCGLCANKRCKESVCAEKCPGHHTCAAPCPDCGLCINEDCADAICAEKCPGHKEEPHVFSSGDYITDKAVSIDTGTFVYDIDPGVYVKGDLQEITDAIVPLMEQFTALNFDGAGYARKNFPDGKIHIRITRDSLYACQDWYQGSPDSEVGNAYGGPEEHVVVSPGDLYLGTSTIIHEASHVLMFRQSEWSYGQLLDEGISTYTTYLVEKELENTNSEISFYIGPSTYSINNMLIFDYGKLYEQPLEYWFENTFEHSLNANYAIGFRFMTYLHEVYGDYTQWILKFEEQYPAKKHAKYSNNAPVDRRISVLKATYGDDVLDNFYPWLKENQSRFNEVTVLHHYADLTAADSINLYPTFNALESRAYMEYFKYKDLYINIETVRSYVGEYKKLDCSGLMLRTTQPVTVKLFRSDGSYTTVITDSKIPLDGISYIQLVGEGSLALLEIIGPFRLMS